MKLTLWDYSVIVLYLLSIIAIGLACSRRNKTSEDYLLGGRKMPWLAVGISCFISLFSTYSLVMVPGEIYNNGLSFWIIHFFSPIFAILAFMTFIRFYFRLKSFTPFEYLEYRYDHKVRLLCASLYAYARLIYLATVLFATSKVFEGGAGWPAWLTITIVGCTGVLFTVIGGIKAIIWSDILQFLVVLGGIIVAIIILCLKIDGGFIGAITYAFDHGRGIDKFSDPEFYLCNPYVRLSFWLLLLGQLIEPFASGASDQVTIQRMLSTSSYKNAFKAMLASNLIAVPMTVVLWFIGLATFTFYRQHPDPAVRGGDTAFFNFVSTQLPTPLPGLIIAAMLAAAIAVLTAVLNSLAALWIKEIHLKYITPGMAEVRQVWVSKWATGIIGIGAVSMGLFIACSSDWLGQSVVEAATLFYAFNAIVFPAFLYAVLSKRANCTLIWICAGILWGLKCGVLTWFMFSKRAVKIWTEGQPMGLGGAISSAWVLVPLALFLIAGAIMLWHYRGRRLSDIALAVVLIPFGYTCGTGLWYIFSRTLIGSQPRELSFLWVELPIAVGFVVLGVVGLYLSKVQPFEKYHGLILFENKEQDNRAESGLVDAEQAKPAE